MRDDDLQLGTRDKVVQKMTREGAVEENISTNSERRVSARASDADFSQLHEEKESTANDTPVERSGTKVQQRRYYRGKSKEDGTQELAREEPEGNTSAVKEDPVLREKSQRTQNLRTEEKVSASGKSDKATDSKNHNRKKKQAMKEEAKKKASRLNFEEEGTASRGTNLGGRFSSITGKAALAGKTVVGASVHGGDEEDSDIGEDAVRKSEAAALETEETIRSRASSRTSSRSKRAEKLEQQVEVKGAKLKFDAEAEATEEAVKSNAKKEIKRRARNKRYASVFRSKTAASAGGAATAKTIVDADVKLTMADRIKNTAAVVFKKNKGVIAVLLVGVLLVVTIIGSLGTMGSVVSGLGGSVFESTYLASDDEIYAAEDAYAALETALQNQLNRIEQDYPGYDEYNYQVDEISHNPYYLTSYLTVLYGNYKAADVQAELERLFQAQYQISVEGSTETVTETRTVRVGESLGSVVTSGYCNCSICCGRWAGGATASGAMPQANHTIAVDSSNPIVPMGTKVVMNGVEYTVEDTGSFARYGVAFDVYYDSHSAASAHGHQTWEAYIADDNGSQSVEVTTTETKRVLNVTLTNNGLDSVARSRLGDSDAVSWYTLLNTSYGNRDYLWDTTAYAGYTPGGMSYEIPPEALTDARFRNMITEAEKYLGYPYVWGGSSPSTSFDCSGFVSWVINNCGNGWNYGRQTAEGLRGLCTYVSPDQAKPGDLIFFQGTYDTAGASHVGIYVGNGMMIHCGDPIQYTSIETNYWQQHFYCFGRLPN